jgi:hypothetical protein
MRWTRFPGQAHPASDLEAHWKRDRYLDLSLITDLLGIEEEFGNQNGRERSGN